MFVQEEIVHAETRIMHMLSPLHVSHVQGSKIRSPRMASRFTMCRNSRLPRGIANPIVLAARRRATAVCRSSSSKLQSSSCKPSQCLPRACFRVSSPHQRFDNAAEFVWSVECQRLEREAAKREKCTVGLSSPAQLIRSSLSKQVRTSACRSFGLCMLHGISRNRRRQHNLFIRSNRHASGLTAITSRQAQKTRSQNHTNVLRRANV